VGESNVLADDLYDRQRTDLRRPTRPETTPDAVAVLDADFGRLVAPEGPPVRISDVLPAVAVTTSPSGRTLVDFTFNVRFFRTRRGRGIAGGALLECLLEHVNPGARGCWAMPG
jgi:alpha-L-rhamnosidase